MSEKHKQNELVHLRFKEIRINYFESIKGSHTQEDFAEYLNVTDATIRNYEKNRVAIPEKHLLKLSKDFGIRLEYLLGEDEYKTILDKEIAQRKDINDTLLSVLERLANTSDDYMTFWADIAEDLFRTCCPNEYKNDMEKLLQSPINSKEFFRVLHLARYLYDINKHAITSFFTFPV